MGGWAKGIGGLAGGFAGGINKKKDRAAYDARTDALNLGRTAATTGTDTGTRDTAGGDDFSARLEELSKGRIPNLRKGGKVRKDGLHYLHEGERVLNKRDAKKRVQARSSGRR